MLLNHQKYLGCLLCQDVMWTHSLVLHKWASWDLGSQPPHSAPSHEEESGSIRFQFSMKCARKGKGGCVSQRVKQIHSCDRQHNRMHSPFFWFCPNMGEYWEAVFQLPATLWELHCLLTDLQHRQYVLFSEKSIMVWIFRKCLPTKLPSYYIMVVQICCKQGTIGKACKMHSTLHLEEKACRYFNANYLG